MSHTFVVEFAQGSELPAAFSLLFQHAPLEDRQRGVDNALGLIERGELERDSVLVVRIEDTVCGVTVFSVNAGTAGQVWPPQARAGHAQQQIEDALLRETIHRLVRAGAKFIQALLTEDESPAIFCLVRAGFAELSSLLTLYHALNTPPDWTNDVAPTVLLNYQTYLQADENLFRQTMLRTYAGSLDFPELNGLRTIDDILDAHRLHGTFHANEWLLAFDGERPVGVLLLVEMAERSDWELSYVGVVPEARQRGIGRELVREALRRAVALRANRLTLTVDARNVPAWSLYASLGFLPLEEHQVFLLVPK